MKKIKLYFILILTFSFSIQSNSQSVPASFADLAERLMPSVVNISTTQTVVTNTNSNSLLHFLQGHLLKICLKNLVHLKKENQQH